VQARPGGQPGGRRSASLVGRSDSVLAPSSQPSQHASAPAPDSLDREVVVGEFDDLVAGEVIDVRTNVGDDLGGHALVVLLCIGDPLVRRICLPTPVAQQ
jgi:hypothetical protein